jgi:hypothetical protein
MTLIPNQSNSPSPQEPRSEAPENVDLTQATEGVDTSTPTPTSTTAPEAEPEVDLDSIINSLSTEGEDATPVTPETIDFSNPKFAELDKGFKEALGIDLKSAFEQFTQAQAIIEQQRVAIEQQAGQQLLSQLSKDWGVTDAELDKRVGTLLEIAQKLPEAERAKYDSIDGLKKLWARVEKAKGGSTGKKSNGVTGTAGSPKASYKASEIRDMMLKDPALYNRSQALIQAALTEGRVIQDL